MKKLLLAVLFSLAFPVLSYADSVTLKWSANTESDLAGYKLYVGTASRTYEHNTDVGNVITETVVNLNEGTTYYFAVTAYDTSDCESGYSNEVSYLAVDTTPPGDPTGLQIILINTQ